MSLFIFLLHFLFIGGIFTAGVAIGYRWKENISEILNKYFQRRG